MALLRPQDGHCRRSADRFIAVTVFAVALRTLPSWKVAIPVRAPRGSLRDTGAEDFSMP